jgi:hypothetical protein
LVIINYRITKNKTPSEKDVEKGNAVLGNDVSVPNYCKFRAHSNCQKHISSSSKHDVLKVLFRGKNSINVTTKHKKLQLQKLWVCVSVYGEDTAAPVNS